MSLLHLESPTSADSTEEEESLRLLPRGLDLRVMKQGCSAFRQECFKCATHEADSSLGLEHTPQCPS